MSISMIIAPIIGAVIGYCTNYIAVKMLFRPLRPKYLFGKQIPFTPGIIPKSKDRIGAAIGSAVGESLLTQEALEQTLLSDDLKENLGNKVNEKIVEMMSDERTFEEAVTYYIDEDEYKSTIEKGEYLVSRKLCEKIAEMNVGVMVAQQVANGFKESVGGFLAGFITEDFIYSLIDPISSKIDEMIKTQGTDIINEKIHEEFDALEEKTVAELVTSLTNTGLNLGELVARAYTILIEKKLGAILKGINISKIVEDKIDSMEIEEVEEMVLSVMKKELNAIVNLGAIIGFVLGCVNLLF